jgi:hypothetical protein
MKTAVLVEKLGQKKYRASTSQPIALESEGRSREEAVKRLCALARKRLAAGEWQQVSLPGPPQTNPWIAYAGIWKDHPDFDEFLKDIAEYRRARNGLDDREQRSEDGGYRQASSGYSGHVQFE